MISKALLKVLGSVKCLNVFRRLKIPRTFFALEEFSPWLCIIWNDIEQQTKMNFLLGSIYNSGE